MTGGRSGDCNDFRGKITTRAGTCGRGVVRVTKDLLLSAVRNDSFLTADNNKSFVYCSVGLHNFNLFFFGLLFIFVNLRCWSIFLFAGFPGSEI